MRDITDLETQIEDIEKRLNLLSVERCAILH